MDKCGYRNHVLIVMAIAVKRLLLEILSAKEAKRWSDCSGKHLGCLRTFKVSLGLQYGLTLNVLKQPRCFRTFKVSLGLQYGLSGNRAIGEGIFMIPCWRQLRI